ncbi:hypothetical protein Tco_0732799 [Tanacetum coccineum]
MVVETRKRKASGSLSKASSSKSASVELAPPQKEQVSITSTKPLEIPERLYDLIQNAARVRKSLKLNSNNRSAKRKLESLESDIHVVSTCCKFITEDLPTDWIYDPETSMAHVPKPPTSPKPKTEKKKKKKTTRTKEIQITWSSPNYHGKYPLKNDELEVWNLFRRTENAEAQAHMVAGVGKDLNMVDKDDMVIPLLGKFAVDTFNRSCQMYVNEDEDNQVSGAEFMECKFYKFSSMYIFYMTIEAIEQGIPGVYETRVECDSDGAKTLMNFKLTDRKPKWNRPWVKPRLESEVEYETVEDGSSDPQDYYELTGLVHRVTEGGGFNYHNPRYSPHRIVYTSIKDETASDFADFEDFAPNVTEPLEFR